MYGVCVSGISKVLLVGIGEGGGGMVEVNEWMFSCWVLVLFCCNVF